MNTAKSARTNPGNPTKANHHAILYITSKKGDVLRKHVAEYSTTAKINPEKLIQDLAAQVSADVSKTLSGEILPNEIQHISTTDQNQHIFVAKATKDITLSKKDNEEEALDPDHQSAIADFVQQTKERIASIIKHQHVGSCNDAIIQKLSSQNPNPIKKIGSDRFVIKDKDKFSEISKQISEAGGEPGLRASMLDLRPKDLRRFFSSKKIIKTITSHTSIRISDNKLDQVIESLQDQRIMSYANNTYRFLTKEDINSDIADKIQTKIKKNHNTKHLSKFYRYLFQPDSDPAITIYKKAFFRAWLAIGASQEQEYFDYIDDDAIQKQFYDQVTSALELQNTKDEPGVLRGKDMRGKSCTLTISSNQKSLNRIIAKLCTKAEIIPSEIYDICRVRIIAANTEADLNSIAAHIIKKLAPQGNKNTAWKLQIKNSRNNPNRDDNRQEIVLIGHFGAKTKDNKTIRMPVEIQILTKKEREKSESQDKHHLVYESFQRLVEISRPQTGLDKGWIQNVITSLANKEEIQKDFQGQDKYAAAEKKLWQKFHTVFFQSDDNKYYAYQHVTRLQTFPELNKNNHLFIQMCKSLNQQLYNLRYYNKTDQLSPTDWWQILYTPDTFIPQALQKIERYKQDNKNNSFPGQNLNYKDNLLKLLKELKLGLTLPKTWAKQHNTQGVKKNTAGLT